jgi:hypothetical protein
MFFVKYRINKIRERISGLKSEIKELDTLVHSGATLPTTYIDDLLDKRYDLGLLEERLIILEEK